MGARAGVTRIEAPDKAPQFDSTDSPSKDRLKPVTKIGRSNPFKILDQQFHNLIQGGLARAGVTRIEAPDKAPQFDPTDSPSKDRLKPVTKIGRSNPFKILDQQSELPLQEGVQLGLWVTLSTTGFLIHRTTGRLDRVGI